MPHNLLEWPKGLGWLVISGGHAPGSPIRAQALERVIADGDVIYISLASDVGDALQDDMEDLGALAGYVVDIRQQDTETYDQVKQASLIALEMGESVDELLVLLNTPVLDSIRWAYERGAIVLLEGEAAAPFGRWLINDDGQLSEGANWFNNVLVAPGVRGLSGSETAQAVLNTLPEAIVIGIAVGSALAFGPDGQIDLWGEKAVSISLGSAYTSDGDMV